MDIPVSRNETTGLVCDDPYGHHHDGRGIITVCLEETPVLGAFMDGRVRDFHTYMRTRFILQVLYKKRIAFFLQYLRIIDKKSGVIEENF